MTVGIALMVILQACSSSKRLTVPVSPRQQVADTLWGDVVDDPYRWLEDLNSEATAHWLIEQEKFSHGKRGRLLRLMRQSVELYSRIDYQPLIKEGKYFFHFQIENPGYAPVLYYQNDLKRQPRKLFDPSSLGQGRNISVDGLTVSENSDILALVLSEGRGDWKTIRFIDMRTRKLLPDVIEHVKYSPVHWSGDGIFYRRYDVKDIRQSFSGLISNPSLYYHELGTGQEDDQLIYSPENEFDSFSFEVTPGGKYLILYHPLPDGGERYSAISHRSLPLQDDSDFRPFILTGMQDKNYYNVIGEVDDKLLVWTSRGSPNGAIYSYDLQRVNSGEIFLPQFVEMLDYVKMIGDKIIRVYNNGKQSFALISNLQGDDLAAWSIPEGYEFSEFSGSAHDDIAIYSFRSFFLPSTFFQINLETLERKPLSTTYVLFEIGDLTTQKVWYPSDDGTLIPMYITHRKDMKPDGNNPTLLYGYGGFGNRMRPFFDVGNLIFLKNGGVLATPALRGGGDFPQWHELGRRLNKQNTFDDFISAAEYLITNNYTRPERLAAMGGSHGGMVVGAAMVQRPDLFRVVVSRAGVFDLLRYHHFNIGYAYEEEIGNVNDSLDYKNLRAYSPYHNIRNGQTYPATLLVAGANDDRVNPFHSFKFLARLQENMDPDRPVVLYFEENAGHGGSAIISDHYDRNAYIYAFIFQHLEMNRMAKFVFY